MKFPFLLARLSLSFTLILCLPLSAAEMHSAKITSTFMAQPTPVMMEGTAGDGSPMNATIILEPKDGYTIAVFPVQEGSSSAVIPTQKITFNPVVPPPSPPLMPSTPVPSSGQFTATFPGRTVTLPYPVPEGTTSMTVHIIPPLQIQMPLMPFSLVSSHPGFPNGVAHSGPGAPLFISLFPVSQITLLIQGQDPVHHYGVLSYAIHVKSPPGHPRSWNWDISGTWVVKIEDYANEPDIAHVTHNRGVNSYSGSLQGVTDPPVSGFSNLSVTNSGSVHTPIYWIQFKKPGGGAKHTLKFSNTMPQGPAVATQPFPNVAMIALGQWMRKMGNPSMKVRSPLTGDDHAIQWTVPVGGDREMELSWKMS